MRRISRLMNCVRGATALEYGLLAATITLVIISALNTAGTQTSDTLDDFATQMGEATGN